MLYVIFGVFFELAVVVEYVTLGGKRKRLFDRVASMVSYVSWQQCRWVFEPVLLLFLSSRLYGVCMCIMHLILSYC